MKSKKVFEQIEDSCGDMSLDAPNENGHSLADVLKARDYDKASEHPTPEMLLIREAVKHLTPKQRKVWDYHSYDKLTQDEIGLKLKISQQMVTKHIKAAEKRITKWCKSNMGAYELLKTDFEGINQ